MPKKRIQIENIISLEDITKIQPRQNARGIHLDRGRIITGGRPMTAAEAIYRDPFSPEAIRARDELVRRRLQEREALAQERTYHRTEQVLDIVNDLNETINELVI